MKKFWLLAMLAFTQVAHAEKIAEVSTSFNLASPNDTIAIEAFDDPKVSGITCHLSRAVKGGLSSLVGLSTDSSDASIACRQIGPISFNPNTLKNGESVFSVKTSPLFKSMQVVRFFDQKRNVLIYLVYSDKLIDGSPKNSISSVPVQKW